MLLICLSAVSAYAQDYIKMFDEACAERQAGRPEKALPMFEYISRNAPEDDSHKSIAAAMAGMCRKEISAKNAKRRKAVENVAKSEPVKAPEPVVEAPPAPVLSVNVRSFHIPPAGTSRELTVTSNNPWDVDYCPEWCEVVKKTDNYLLLRFKENTTGVGREERVRIVSGELNQVVGITQDPMPVIEKESARSKVFFRTVPDNVRVSILDSHVYGDTPSHSYDLTEGEHAVSFTKFGYRQFDTTLVVTPGQDNGLMIVDVELKPTFGILVPSVSLEDEYLIPGDAPKVKFYVNDYYIDLDDELRARSFDSDEGVVYSSLYKGGNIPLKPGTYKVRATAENYKDYEADVVIKEGENFNLNFTMKLDAGYLTLHDMGNADGADVYDESMKLYLGKVGEKLKLLAGSHTILVDKPGYTCNEGLMTVDIRPNVTSEAKVTMTRTVVCRVSTVNTMENVYINGELVEFHQSGHEIVLNEGETYEIRITKDGYWPYVKTITVSPVDDVISLEGIVLQPLEKLTVKTNEPGVTVHLYKRDKSDEADYGNVTFADGQKEVEMYVPKADYRIEMTRDQLTNKLAYKGRLNFTKSKNRFYFQTYPKYNFMVLGADLNLKKGNPLVGNMWFGQFKIFKGLSTDIVKGAVLNSAAMGSPEGLTGAPEYMFAATPLFLNYDFRMGGSFCQFGDINLLLSYAWYPAFTKVVPWTHFSGHEAFGGLEVSTRMKVLNLNVRAGLQYFNGCRNFYPGDAKKGASKPDEFFVKAPFDQMMFVISAGFSLGSKNANGRNLLRLF